MNETEEFKNSKCPICKATLREGGCLLPERCVAAEMKMQENKYRQLSDAAESISIINLEKMMMPE